MRLILLLVYLLLTACGQKGDLYLPDPAEQSTEDAQAADTKKNKDKKS